MRRREREVQDRRLVKGLRVRIRPAVDVSLKRKSIPGEMSNLSVTVQVAIRVSTPRASVSREGRGR
jgi:hypothetical protein